MLEALKPVARWSKKQKAEVLWALDRNLVTLDQIRAAHGISADEIAEWRRNLKLLGENGLKVTQARECRRAGRRMATLKSAGLGPSVYLR